jgi:hypothetical protein
MFYQRYTCGLSDGPFVDMRKLYMGEGRAAAE